MILKNKDSETMDRYWKHIFKNQGQVSLLFQLIPVQLEVLRIKKIC